MFLPKAHRALFAPFLSVLAACGDPGSTLDSPGEVGAANASVVGGWAATTEQIFATVEIRRVGAAAGFCSGALVSPLVVATAAHCAVIEPEPGVVKAAASGALEVVAGHLSSAGADPSMVRSVREIAVHEGYNHDFIMGRSHSGAGKGGMGAPHDIALLFLSIPFEELPNAPMLPRTQADELVRHGDVGFVAGYGVYDVDEDLSGALYISDAVIDILGQQEFLTRRPDQIGDSCYGDSGGPFYVPTEHGDFLIGLVSRGRSDVQRDCGDGGVYTLLSAYLSWIAETAGSRFAPQIPADAQLVAFRAAGDDGLPTTKGGALRRTDSCAALRANGGTPLASALALLLGIVWLQRRPMRV